MQSNINKKKLDVKAEVSSTQSSTKFGISTDQLQVIQLAEPQPKYVWVRDKSTNNLKKVVIADLQQIIGHNWENVIYYQEEFLKEFDRIYYTHPPENFSQVQQTSATAIDALFIGHMEMSGWGVFSRKPLNIGVKFLTNGLLLPWNDEAIKRTPLPDGALHGYSSGLFNPHGEKVARLKPSGVNMATLFQHAPTKAELTEYWELSPGLDPESIATANIFGMIVKYPDLPFPTELNYLTAPVVRGQPLMRSYGNPYWAEHNQKPILFYRHNGKPIPSELYKCPRVVRHKTKEGLEVDILFSFKQLKTLFTTLTHGKDYSCKSNNGTVLFTPEHRQEFAEALFDSDEGNHFRIDMLSMKLDTKNIVPLDQKNTSTNDKPTSTFPLSAISSIPSVTFHEKQTPLTLFKLADKCIQDAKSFDKEGKKAAYEKSITLFQQIIDYYTSQDGDQSIKLQNAYCRMAEVQYALAMLNSKDTVLLEKSAANFSIAVGLTLLKNERCERGLAKCQEALQTNKTLEVGSAQPLSASPS